MGNLSLISNLVASARSAPKSRGISLAHKMSTAVKRCPHASDYRKAREKYT